MAFNSYGQVGGAVSSFMPTEGFDFSHPLRGHRFLVEGLGDETAFSSWKSISGFNDSIQQEAKAYREGGFANPWDMWIPDGKATPGSTEIEFEKGMLTNKYDMIQLVDDYLTGKEKGLKYISVITVTLYDAYGQKPVAAWEAKNCFPIGYDNGNTFDASSSDLWMEKLKVKCEYITRSNSIGK